MNKSNTGREEIVDFDLMRLLDALIRKAWLIILVSILSACLTFFAVKIFVTPTYQSSAMFYVNNSSLSVGDASVNISSGDITASRSLVNTYIVILNSNATLNDVIDYAGIDMSAGSLSNMLTAEAVNNTEVFRIVVTHPDPKTAEKIADAITYILPKRISTIVDGTSAKIVDTATTPSKPSAPNYTTSTLVGFLLGFVLTVSVIILHEMFDITIRTEDDITQATTLPILASVPDMTAPSKGGYYRGYGASSAKKATPAKDAVLIGEEINFAASEAYKLLRSKLQYSFSNEDSCRIIGVCSAMTGEGKSLTSLNLSYTLSQLGNRVLLIDCDMRRPSVAAKLHINRKPGLSGYLSAQHQVENLVQLCGLKEDNAAFHVIAAGQNPPNPVELLSSARMNRLLTHMREFYDYIILDLPPVGEVSDAIAIAKEVDGFLLVVRQNHCTRPALSDAVRQFEFIDAKILGLTYNCASERTKGYGKKYYKYYKAYTPKSPRYTKKDS